MDKLRPPEADTVNELLRAAVRGSVNDTIVRVTTENYYEKESWKVH